MQLYIKQKVFALTDTYHVYTADQEPVYLVKREFFTWGAKFHVYDTNEQELYYIQQKVFVFLPEYEIYRNGILCARVAKELTFFRPRLNVSSAYGDYTLQGDFWDMDFDILKDGALIGSIRKEWLSWGDTYMLDIAQEQDAAFFCSLVIAIDNCLHNGKD